MAVSCNPLSGGGFGQEFEKEKNEQIACQIELAEQARQIDGFGKASPHAERTELYSTIPTDTANNLVEFTHD